MPGTIARTGVLRPLFRFQGATGSLSTRPRSGGAQLLSRGAGHRSAASGGEGKPYPPPRGVNLMRPRQSPRRWYVLRPLRSSRYRPWSSVSRVAGASSGPSLRPLAPTPRPGRAARGRRPSTTARPVRTSSADQIAEVIGGRLGGRRPPAPRPPAPRRDAVAGSPPNSTSAAAAAAAAAAGPWTSSVSSSASARWARRRSGALGWAASRSSISPTGRRLRCSR